MHTIIVSENDNVKTWSFEPEEAALAQHGGKRRSMRNRLSITTNGSSYRSETSSLSPSPRSYTRQTTANEIQDELRRHEQTRDGERKVKEYERKQYLKYNGVDIHSPGHSRMSEEEMLRYAMNVSREGSFQSRSFEDFAAAGLVDVDVKSGAARSEAAESDAFAAPADSNEFDMEIQLAMMLSLDDK